MDTRTHENHQPINILAFDTSGDEASLALWVGGKMYDATLSKGKGIHSQAACLIPMMQDLMKEANINFQDLDIVATSRGPGSFTGIRIGLATAQGLLLSTHAKVFAPTTFDIAAFSAWSQKPDAYFITITTKRESYYCQSFDNALHSVGSASIMTEEEIQNYLKQYPHLVRVNHPAIMSAQQLVRLYLQRHEADCTNESAEIYQLANQLRPFYGHDPEFVKQKPWSL
jgi:tRNA threonylcarbamoyladenosine biosynthesis protein TsaB